jgi:hypothetical protein
MAASPQEWKNWVRRSAMGPANQLRHDQRGSTAAGAPVGDPSSQRRLPPIGPPRDPTVPIAH